MYSILEQHKDGSWWYHPGMTYNTHAEAEEEFQKNFWWDQKRPHIIVEHQKPLYQRFSTCTRDFSSFEFGGKIFWEGELKIED